MPLLANGRDVPDGQYVMEEGRLDLNWTSAPSEEYYQGVEQGFRDVCATLGEIARVAVEASQPVGDHPPARRLPDGR
jgi:hypothetical protein